MRCLLTGESISDLRFLQVPPCGSGNRPSKATASVFALENDLHLVTIHQASIHVLPMCISEYKMLMLGCIIFLK